MGRRLSEERLLAAAGDLLVDVGPHGATVREIARRAGVNHGLVHHYFGSKDQLLRAAMIVLLEEHRAYVKAATDGGPLPRPLGLLDQQRYLRAIAHCVLDGEMELAALEATEGVSVPRSVLEYLATVRRESRPSVESKSVVAHAMAFEMGWVLLEPFIFRVLDVSDDEVAVMRRAAMRARETMAEQGIG